jgi:hypothetical protein
MSEKPEEEDPLMRRLNEILSQFLRANPRLEEQEQIVTTACLYEDHFLCVDDAICECECHLS